jgi:hypothetical protein
MAQLMPNDSKCWKVIRYEENVLIVESGSEVIMPIIDKMGRTEHHKKKWMLSLKEDESK